MRAVLQGLAEHSGLSLAAGGTVTGLGGALLAVGLTEVAGSARSPFHNGWVVAGFVVAVLGVLWVVGSLVLALLAYRKAACLRDCLGEALDVGEGLRRARLGHKSPTPESVDDWLDRTHALIAAGLGEAEARYFLADAGGTAPTPEAQKWEEVLSYRLSRLAEIMQRPVHARLDFPTHRNWFEGFQPRTSQ
jgi:hypothetical protein